MKELIRGVACLALALGATACEDDPSVDFGGSPTTVQLSPNVMFITSGTTKELLVRLVNDRNQAVPTSFTVSNVGAGLNVVFDSLFRPEQTISNPELTSPLIKTQQRYFIEANLPGGAQRTFTLTSGSLSGSPTINIEPSTVGAMSLTGAAALGETVTIAALPNQSFTTSGGARTTVFFVTLGDTLQAVITDLTTTSVSFIPLPNSTGPANVTGITLDFAPTLAPRRLTTTNEIVVPPNPVVIVDGGVNQPSLVTAPGFKFLPDFNITFGGVTAITVSVAADSNSAMVVLPAGVDAAQEEKPVYNNLVFATLTSVPITGLPHATAVATAATPYDGSAPDGNALVINVPDPVGTELVIYDTPVNFGEDLMGLGGDTKYYQVVIPSDGVRGFNIAWGLDDEGEEADFDFVVCSDPTDFGTCVIGSLTGSNPEADSGNLTAGVWWLLIANFDNGPVGMMTITID